MLFLFFVTSAQSQIGIGTTSPNSTLDIRGSLSLKQRGFTASATAADTDNILVFTGVSAATLTLPDAATCTGRTYTVKNTSATVPLPVLSVTTTLSQTIDGGTLYLLDEIQKSITVISSGTGWNIAGATTINKTRANYVIVKSASDFPAPVAGVITLVAGTVYEVNGTVIMTSKIDLNHCYLIGADANNDKLIYTPATGELFTGTNGGTMKVLTLMASTTGAKLFNLNLTSVDNLMLRNCVIASCKDVGIVKGGNVCFFSTINYAGNLNGITFQNIPNLFLDNIAWFPTNSNTFEKFVGTFNIIEKLGGFSQPMSSLTATAIDVSGITSIADVGAIKSTAFVGNGTKVAGTFSNKWEVESSGLNTEKDDVSTGNLYISTTAATSFAAVNAPAKIAGTTTASSLFRVSSPSNNRLTYSGTKSKRFQVICSLSSIASGNNKNFSFYFSKNGSILPESKQFMKFSSQVDRGSITLSCTAQLTTNDYIEVWAENNSDATSLTVESMNVAIK